MVLHRVAIRGLVEHHLQYGRLITPTNRNWSSVLQVVAFHHNAHACKYTLTHAHLVYLKRYPPVSSSFGILYYALCDCVDNNRSNCASSLPYLEAEEKKSGYLYTEFAD